MTLTDTGELYVEVDHQPAGDLEQLRAAVQAALDQALAGLARSALLLK